MQRNSNDQIDFLDNFVDKVMENIPIIIGSNYSIIKSIVYNFVKTNATWANGDSGFLHEWYNQAHVLYDNDVRLRTSSYPNCRTQLYLESDITVEGTYNATGDSVSSDNISLRIDTRDELFSHIETPCRTALVNVILRELHFYSDPQCVTIPSSVSAPTQSTTETQTQTITQTQTQMETTKTGVLFTNTGHYGRDEVRGYHGKPSPIMRDKTKYPIDLVGVRRRDKVRAILQTDEGFVARYTIGFEVEKNRFADGSVKEYPLFCGFESDGSCGVEAVTHILPLIPASTWRNKVFNMFYEAERVVDDTHSPSDERCGGHITIGVKGMRGEEILEKIRKNSAIILAMFRHRLTNKYCGANVNMINFHDNKYGKEAKRAIRGVCEPDSGSTRYQVALVKEISSNEGVVEFRIPSRIQNVKQMVNRYELMYELVNFSINRPTATYESFLKEIMPILERTYQDPVRLQRTVELSRSFNKMIRTGRINKDVKEFVDPNNAYERLYDKELLEITNGITA